MPARSHDPRSAVASLLLHWQATGDEQHLESLVDAVRPIAERTAKATLRRHQIHDPAAVDDVVSLVFDHIRRLPSKASDERRVAPFMPSMTNDDGDAGVAFIIWLATERARDVARSCRSRARRALPFSQLDAVAPREIQQLMATPARPGPGRDAIETDAESDRANQLRAAMQQLEPRLTTVLRMLLDGKSQSVIAATLEVCEGTVSRMRVRAIERLRELMRPK